MDLERIDVFKGSGGFLSQTRKLVDSCKHDVGVDEETLRALKNVTTKAMSSGKRMRDCWQNGEKWPRYRSGRKVMEGELMFWFHAVNVNKHGDVEMRFISAPECELEEYATIYRAVEQEVKGVYIFIKIREPKFFI